jgi:glutathione S-transferase
VILYGSALSRAMRVMWLAAELGIRYEHRNWNPRAPETRTPEYLALNPNGRLPTLDDDGFILSESMAINCYLAKKHGSSLYPKDPQREALVWQWSLWETDRLDRQLPAYYAHTRGLPEAQRDRAVADDNWKQLTAAFGVLETALAKSDWLVDTGYSVADINVAAAMYRALSLDLAKWRRLQAWLLRCWDRPAAAEVRAVRDRGA